jgi:hypothetical protein
MTPMKIGLLEIKPGPTPNEFIYSRMKIEEKKFILEVNK